MVKNFNILILRHFKTEGKHQEEKIIYKDAFEQAKPFIQFIKKYIEKYNNVNRIVFVSSPQERTIMTGLILSSILKGEIIEQKMKKIDIIDPVIDKAIDRDPHKKKHVKTCKILKQKINNEYKEDDLYIFVTHSSLIYNTFKCLLNNFAKTEKDDFSERIHSFSVSSITKVNNRLTYEFNRNLKN